MKLCRAVQRKVGKVTMNRVLVSAMSDYSNVVHTYMKGESSTGTSRKAHGPAIAAAISRWGRQPKKASRVRFACAITNQH
jgi:hypothetical protein